MLQPSGILLVDKPQGITSNDLIQKIKRKLDIKKIGHAGTLDPLATGLMVVLVNSATKISNYLLTQDKSYTVNIKLFVKTDSADITGKVIEQEAPYKLDKKNIKSVIDKYNGYIYEQTPPVFSAVKVDGKEAYKYAHSGNIEDVRIKSRPVTINSCELLKYDNKTNNIILSVTCSKGTYIRALVEDIARDLNTIGTVEELRRIKSGEFSVDQAAELDNISMSDLVSMYDGLLKNRQVLVLYHNEAHIKQGKPIELVNKSVPTVFITNTNNDVIAVYERIAKNLYACKRGLWEEDPDVTKTQAELDGLDFK